MEPPVVRYARTDDGFDIAYAVWGSGLPFVWIPGQFSHLELNIQYQHLEELAWSEELSRRFRLVQFDGRGQGMSSRNITTPQTIESLSKDTQAVVQQLGLDRYFLLARWTASHIAIRHAFAHPNQVVALILITCAEDNARWPPSLFQGLPAENWEVFLLSQFPRAYTLDQTRQSIERVNRVATPEDTLARAKGYAVSNVEDLLPRLAMPTLVLHPREFRFLSADESIKVAARIPNARFRYIDGEMVPGDPVTGIRAIDDFVASTPELAALIADAGAPPMTPTTVPLTRRETEVLRLIAKGWSNQRLADELVISVRTVERHITNIYAKLEIHGKAEATAYALRHHLD